MAFPDKTGKMHHSASRARLHDDMAAEKSKSAAPKHAGAGAEPPPEDADKNVSHMDIGDVVAQHGPAEHVHIAHGENSHTVTSHHSGGHHHHSEHPTGEAAHDHGKMAAGLDGNMDAGLEPQPDQPDDAAMMGSSSAGGGIPGMADKY